MRAFSKYYWIITVLILFYILYPRSELAPMKEADVLLIEINKIRVDHGRQPLIRHSGLDESAQAKADDLVARDYWSHDTPDGDTFSKAVFERNKEARAAGENLAKCYTTRTQAVQAWVDSPSHYENILGDWEYWGSGQAESNGCKYYVNHFSR